MKVSMTKPRILDFDIYFNKAAPDVTFPTGPGRPKEFFFHLGFGYRDYCIRLYVTPEREGSFSDIGKLTRESTGWRVTLYNHKRYGNYIDRFLEIVKPIALHYEEETGQEIVITDEEEAEPKQKRGILWFLGF